MIKNIYIFGDSLVNCDQLKFKNRWTYLLEKNFRNKLKVFIKAINGLTTKEALKKMSFKTSGYSIVLLLFGTNDSIYYQSMNGKPLVSEKKFELNYLKIIKIIKKNKKAKIFIINSHKFYRRRFEGNKKTHNSNFMKYNKILKKVSKLTNVPIINTYNYLLKFKTKNYTLPLPDGLHLSKFGSKKYYEKINDEIKNLIND